MTAVRMSVKIEVTAEESQQAFTCFKDIDFSCRWGKETEERPNSESQP